MKHACEVIQDLMPLCIDDTASQTSRTMVLEHTAECGVCQKMFEETKQALPQDNLPDELRPEVKLVRRARRIRLWKRIIALMLACAILFTGGYVLIDKFSHEWTYLVDTKDYDLVLSRRDNGDIIITTKRLNNRTMSYFTQFDPADGVIVYGMQSFWLPRSVTEENSASAERDNHLLWIEGEGLFMDNYVYYETDRISERTRVNEIWTNGELLYTHGDDIPLVSDELEEYMQVYDQLYGTRGEYWGRWADYWDEQASVESQLAESRSLHDQLNAMGSDIPEWQK